MAAGRMPSLARLERAGSGGVLARQQPPLSPLLWTTMMTGRRSASTASSTSCASTPRPGGASRSGATSGGCRRCGTLPPTPGGKSRLWVCGRRFRRTRRKGLLVSNVFLSARGSVERALSPAREAPWAERVRQAATASVDLAAMRRLLPDLSADELAAAAASSDPFAEKVPGLRQVLVQTEIVRRLSLGWLTNHPTRLAAVYFEGTDTIGHLFAPFVPPALAGVAPADVPVRPDSGALLRARRRGDRGARGCGCALGCGADDRLGPRLRMGDGRPAGLSSVAVATAAKWHRESGIYLLVGPGIPARPGHLGRGGIAQVAATLLSLVDLPAVPGMAPALADAGPAPSAAWSPTPHPRVPEPSSIQGGIQVPQPGGVSGGRRIGVGGKAGLGAGPDSAHPGAPHRHGLELRSAGHQ